VLQKVDVTRLSQLRWPPFLAGCAELLLQLKLADWQCRSTFETSCVDRLQFKSADWQCRPVFLVGCASWQCRSTFLAGCVDL